MARAPFVLLVNPWITDFAAFDMWAKPMGLLQLGALLREGGCGVAYLDCLDRHDPFTNGHPEIRPGTSKKFGTGKFPKAIIPKPPPYAGIPRHYYRHGIHPDSLRRRLQALPRPHLIWVTSLMTYWYPGVVQTISAIREVFPDVPVWLGGIYARLCSRHAGETSGADLIVTDSTSLLPCRIEAATGFRPRNASAWGKFREFPPPALDLASRLDYAPLAASQGCPFRCPYCASHLLHPVWEKRDSDAIYRDIIHWHSTLGVTDFAFYDDALLLQAEDSLRPALERTRSDGPPLRFHTPNALHVRALSPEWCRLLHDSGFVTLRLGLETTRSNRQKEWGGKVEMEMFLSAVKHLETAGFSRSRIGVYLLCGLPGQKPEEVAEAIRIVREIGAHPYLSEYSPVPGTPMWHDACASSPFDLAGEPLYHNNTFFACQRPDFTYGDLDTLKKLAREARR